MKNWLLVLLLAATAALGQSTATYYVRGFPGADVGTKTTAAQAACMLAAVPCTIVFEPALVGMAAGVTPAKCALCTWQDWRTRATATQAAITAAVPKVVSAFTNDVGYLVTPSVASGVAALNASAIPSATCAPVVTVSAVGVTTASVLTAGFSGDPSGTAGYTPVATGMLTILPYPGAGNVNFKVCNTTAGSITPGPLSLNWKVVK